MNMMVQDPGVCVREPRAGASVWIRGSPGGGDAWSGVGLHRNRRGRGKPCWRAIRLEHLDFLFKVVTVLSEVLCSNQMYTFKLRLTLRFFFLGCSRAMAPHSSTLAWRIPWTEEPGGLKSMGSAKSQTRLSDFAFTFHFHVLEKEMATHSSVLAWRIPGWGSLVGCCLWGHRVRHD